MSRRDYVLLAASWLIFFDAGVLDVQDPGHDDFELWSPSEERNERCLFGRQVRFSQIVIYDGSNLTWPVDFVS